MPVGDKQKRLFLFVLGLNTRSQKSIHHSSYLAHSQQTTQPGCSPQNQTCKHTSKITGCKRDPQEREFCVKPNNTFINSPNSRQFKFQYEQAGKEAGSRQVQRAQKTRKRHLRNLNLELRKGLPFKCKSLPAGHQDPWVVTLEE